MEENGTTHDRAAYNCDENNVSLQEFPLNFIFFFFNDTATTEIYTLSLHDALPILKVVWTHRTWGDMPDPKYPWSATLYGDKGTLKASVFSYDYTPLGGGDAMHGDAVFE